MRTGLLSAAIGLGILAAAPAQSVVQDEAENAGEDAPASAEIICRRQPAPTGSRIGARNVCKTARQWALIEGQSRDALENGGNRNRYGNWGMNGGVEGRIGRDCGPASRNC